MPIIAPADLKTKLYPEIQNLISRGDNSIVTEAISVAIEEAKLYLMRFDIVAIFGDDTTNPAKAATFTNAWLLSALKAMAAWNLVQLAGPTISLELARTSYEDAIRVLKLMQKGEAAIGWPMAPVNTSKPNTPSSLVYAKSNPKQSNYF